MAEDIRRSAEIRRMASQKVAAELMKEDLLSIKDGEAGWARFVQITDLIDEDVAAAGDRAIAGIQRVENRAAPYTNGGESREIQAEVSPDVKLNDLQQKKMLVYLNEHVVETQALEANEPGKIGRETFKVKLWTMQLPNVIPHKDLVNMLTLEQAMTLYGWIKEASVTPDAAA